MSVAGLYTSRCIFVHRVRVQNARFSKRILNDQQALLVRIFSDVTYDH